MVKFWKRLVKDYKLKIFFNRRQETGKPDFPFMFCWANHDWEAKEWNSYET